MIKNRILRANFCLITFSKILDEKNRITILEQICLGAVSYRQIKNKEVLTEVENWLSIEQKEALEILAPE